MRLRDLGRLSADRRTREAAAGLGYALARGSDMARNVLATDRNPDRSREQPAGGRGRNGRRIISPLRAGGALLAADLIAYMLAFGAVWLALSPPTGLALDAISGLAPYAAHGLAADAAHGLAADAGHGVALDAVGRLGAFGLADIRSWGVMAVAACLVMIYAARGHYSERLPGLVETWHILSATTIAVVAGSVISFFLQHRPFSAAVILMWLLAMPLQLVLRRVAKWALAAAGCWRLRTLLIGDVANLDALSLALESEAALGYDIVRRAPLPAALPADDALLDQDYWTSSLANVGADFVAVATGGTDPDAEQRVIDSLTHARVPFAVAPRLSGFPVHSVSPHYFFSHDVVLIVSRNHLARPVSRGLKLAIDLSAAAVLLLLLAPLLLVVAAYVKSDGGPVLFAHERLGVGGRRFKCLKFRTMVTNSQQVLAELLASDPTAAAEWRASQKLRNDPRITPIGRFLRRTSLDELPQLFNILAGDMSLVGPRPIVEAEIERYDRDISFYYAARPGVTGLWQVSGRSDTSYDQRVRLDVWYVKNWSLWHDVAILMKTVPAILLRRGAV